MYIHIYIKLSHTTRDINVSTLHRRTPSTQRLAVDESGSLFIAAGTPVEPLHPGGLRPKETCDSEHREDCWWSLRHGGLWRVLDKWGRKGFRAFVLWLGHLGAGWKNWGACSLWIGCYQDGGIVYDWVT